MGLSPRRANRDQSANTRLHVQFSSPAQSKAPESERFRKIAENQMQACRS